MQRPQSRAMAPGPTPPYLLVGVSSIAGAAAVESTRSRIHIPDSPWPGTPQKIRYLPAGAALSRMTSVA